MFRRGSWKSYNGLPLQQNRKQRNLSRYEHNGISCLLYTNYYDQAYG